MEYSEDFLKKIVQLGTLAYPLSKIINVLDIEDEKQFTKDFDNKDSVIYKSYKKGMDKGEFILDSKLFDMAKNGDLSAMEKYEEKKRANIKKAEQESYER